MDTRAVVLGLIGLLTLMLGACAGDGRDPGDLTDGGLGEGDGRATVGDACGAVNAFGECTGKPGPSADPVPVHDGRGKYESAGWDCSCIRFLSVEDAMRYRSHDFTLNAIGKMGVRQRTCADTLEGAIERAEPACDEGADGRCVCETCCPISDADGLEITTCTDDDPGECPLDRLCPDQPAECAP